MRTHIIIHHSATPDHPILNDWEAHRHYHTSWRYQGEIITKEKADELISQGMRGVIPPWDDIGYHHGVELTNNGLYHRRGRPENVDGAHCLGMNHTSIGILVNGNFDKAAPTSVMYLMTANICWDVCKRQHIKIENIDPHHKYAEDRTCPGTLFNMDLLRHLTEVLLRNF